MTTDSTDKKLVEDANAIFRASVRRVQAPKLLDASDATAWAPASLDAYEAIRVVGMGKAAQAMAGVIGRELSSPAVDGVVIVPEGYPDTYPDALPAPSTFEVIEGGHPLPSREGVSGARRILERAEVATDEELLLVLVSGGGTALSTLPRNGLELEDLKTAYHQLLTGGVGIHEANAVRKHLTQLGGGQLAQAAHPADVGALVVSDVVGNDISVIASGPTAPDPSTYEDAVRVLYRHDLWHDGPAPIRDHLAEGARGNHPETPGPAAACFDRTRNTLLGTNRTALEAAREAAEERGYVVSAVTEGVEGEARSVGRDHVHVMLEEAPSAPTCWLWGGETTVTVRGEGKGGRNQEVALGGALALEETDRSVLLLSGGTDGIDGPTDAAGAWATPSTATDARAAGHDPEAHLAENDAYPLFDAIGQLIRTGPTHTNVMDVQVGLVQPTR